MLHRSDRETEELLQLRPEYEARLEVMRELAYVSRVDGRVLLKGHVASNMGNAHELLFSGALEPLAPADLAALLSCFVFENRPVEKEMISEYLKFVRAELPVMFGAYEMACQLAVQIEEAQNRVKTQFPEGQTLFPANEFERTLNPCLMLAVHRWASSLVCTLSYLSLCSRAR